MLINQEEKETRDGWRGSRRTNFTVPATLLLLLMKRKTP
jgi:hypothetical protein